jgi:hypothetical protein
MSKATARPKAAKAARSDAALFALVKKCLEVEARRNLSMDRLTAAEDHRRKVLTPVAVRRTHEDAEMRLFVGSPVGGCYSSEEIGTLRIFCRREARQSPSDSDTTQAYIRALEIVKAWADWQKTVEQEEKNSGYTALETIDRAIAKEHEGLLAELAYMRAKTLQGLLAKVRAARFTFNPPMSVTEEITESLHKFGPDFGAFKLSLARDLEELAGVDGAAVV